MAKTPKDGSPKSPPPSAPDLRLVGAAAFAAADSWQGREDARLARDNKGVVAELANVVTILRMDPKWKDIIAYDEFAGRVVKRVKPPFEPSEVGEWLDIDDRRLALWLAFNYGLLRVKRDVIEDAVLMTGDQNRFHEVREYLRSLKWDGKPRLRYWLHAYLGVTDADYVQLVSVKWMVGAVARVMRAPRETKMDNVLILEGLQDAGKSTALKILFDPWFTDAAFEIASPDGNQIIRGNWGVELAEMDGYNRADSNRSKAFFSRGSDRYRNPYGRKPITVVRQMVFAGSINSMGTYLKDDTGNRRYWPVTVGYIDLDELRADRDQLWAEALVEFDKGTTWWVAASEKAMFVDEQEQRYVGDALEDKIRAWLDDIDEDTSVKRQRVSTRDILTRCMHLEVGKWTMAEQQRVGRIMARIGWPRNRSGGGSREWVYTRPEGKGGQE